MSHRYLFGPVGAQFAEENLYRQRQSGDCLVFDRDGGADLTIGLGETWEAVCSRLPSGWQPDFIVLYLPCRTIPACLWSAPAPVVGLAADWNLHFHRYRFCLPRCDLVLTDKPGVEVLRREGMEHVRAANLFGLAISDQRSARKLSAISDQRSAGRKLMAVC